MAPPDPTSQDQGRIFSRHVKEQCWQKASEVPGRDPARWRLDAAGNPVLSRLRGCDGCLCHEYDHIIPFSKGGPSSLQNCQILQTRPNRMKGNEEDDPAKLRAYSCARKWNEREMDMAEMAVYGGVLREGLQCRCKSNMELLQAFNAYGKKPALPDCP